MSFRVAEKLGRSKVERDENSRKNWQECQLKDHSSERNVKLILSISISHLTFVPET
jgi:hypothetical protein